MSYEQSLLSPGEKVLGLFKPHIIPYIGWYWVLLAGAGGMFCSAFFGTGPIGLIGGGVFLAIWLWRILDWSTNILMVTNRRVVKSSGILSKKTQDSSLDKITDLALTQSILARVLNYGTLRVLTANENADEVFHSLADPKTAKSVLLEAKSVAGGSKGSAGADSPDGDIAAIERLHRSGVISDDQARDLARVVASVSKTVS